MKMFKKTSRCTFESIPNRKERKRLLKEKREKLDYGFYNDERLPQGHSWVKQGWGTQYECELCREKIVKHFPFKKSSAYFWVRTEWAMANTWMRFYGSVGQRKNPDSLQIWAGVCYGRRMDEALS